MPKFVFMPPQDELKQWFATRLADTMPEYEVVSPATDAEALAELPDADGAFGWIPPEALPTAKRLRWLQNPDAGPFYGFYYPELLAHPVTICNPRGIYSDHISHHIMMFVLALSRGLPWYVDAQRNTRWDKDARKSEYINLASATALINGMGGIGTETARLCREFGMNVIGIDPMPERWTRQSAARHGTDIGTMDQGQEQASPTMTIREPSGLDASLPDADFVINTAPHTPATEGLFNAARFALMKPTAYFINVGRGMVCKIDDLADAIESGEIAGCGLDVYEIEPLPADHKLWRLPNVLMTPHIAVKDADDIPERRFQIILENARRFAKGDDLINVVDKQHWA